MSQTGFHAKRSMSKSGKVIFLLVLLSLIAPVIGVLASDGLANTAPVAIGLVCSLLLGCVAFVWGWIEIIQMRKGNRNPRSRFLTIVAILLSSLFTCICPLACLNYEFLLAPVSRVKFEFQIREGMSLEEVKAILGPDCYPCEKEPERQQGKLPPPRGEKVKTMPWPDGLQGDEVYRWDISRVIIWIGFKDGKVCDKRWKRPE